MDIGGWVDKAMPEYLVLKYVICALQQFWICFAVVPEVGILTSKLIHMPCYLSEEMTLLGINQESKCLLRATRAHQ